VDIGAHDGIELSNTYLLEKQFDWSGLCIEANPYTFQKLKENRPNSVCLNKLVFNTSGEKVEFNIAKDPMYSGISKLIVRHTHTLNDGEKVVLDTETLSNILSENNSPMLIDYMTIDVEGAELQVLKSIDFVKYKFALIHLEHNYIETNRKLIHDFLISNDYVFFSQNEWDDEYVHKSYLNLVA
jgi:FkbM family methyltransferase